MGVEIKYFDKEDIPCTNLMEAAGMADRLAKLLERKKLNAQTVKTICLQCGVKIHRTKLPDGSISYVPGKSWSEKCQKAK